MGTQVDNNLFRVQWHHFNGIPVCTKVLSYDYDSYLSRVLTTHSYKGYVRSLHVYECNQIFLAGAIQRRRACF